MEQKITLVELKAAGYDALAQVQNWQKRLDNINDQIRNWREPVKKEEPKHEARVIDLDNSEPNHS